ncbi:metallophosphoesterase [Paenibacillus ginsengarvi]|uniref:Metallophosphoesterase n=1 Tax=Paenibacillus ginsengarvi TaxID=400777 RepID=A0A3B0BCT2_9BACL|nr:metallophosphoesterase [Paenibacillus ginsengarvi]
MKFREEGTFTIAQLTDVHYADSRPEDELSLALIESVLREERPDLAVFTGDLIRKGPDARAQFARVTSLAAEAGIPYAFIFGNHDSRRDVTREELMAIEEAKPYCLAQAGPERISGVGNYSLPVYASRGGETAAAVLYLFDSECNAPPWARSGSGGKGEWIDRDKVEWYVRESAAYAGAYGGPLPALAFIHIPLPEYEEVWRTGVCYGSRHAKSRCPELNVGLFAAMTEMGDVMGTFAGHDHSSDYWGELGGIRLCYGRVTGFNGDLAGDMQRGARLIRLHEGKRGFDTWVRQADGSVVTNPPEHAPEH